MFGPIRHVIFDLDGTLVNTMPTILRGLKGAIESGLGRPVDDAEFLAALGPPPRSLIKLWIPDDAAGDEAYKQWLRFESTFDPADMPPFAGVPEMLSALKETGIGLLLFTGRDRAGATRTLQHHKWLGEYFTIERMRCGDDAFPSKPSPVGLAALLREHHVDPSTALMVGDHAGDMLAGRGAGTKTGAALWDLPPGIRTERSRFREAWTKWEGLPVDVRLIEPSSLLKWLVGEKVPGTLE